MTNRRKIMDAAKAAGYEVKSLTFERERDCAYGDSWDASCWCLETACGETFESDKGDTVDECVDNMIQEMIQEMIPNKLQSNNPQGLVAKRKHNIRCK